MPPCSPAGPSPLGHPARFFLVPRPHRTGTCFFFKVNRNYEFPTEVLKSLVYESVLLYPQLAQLVIDLNNQMQQKDKEMQMNEAKWVESTLPSGLVVGSHRLFYCTLVSGASGDRWQTVATLGSAQVSFLCIHSLGSFSTLWGWKRQEECPPSSRAPAHPWEVSFALGSVPEAFTVLPMAIAWGSGCLLWWGWDQDSPVPGHWEQGWVCGQGCSWSGRSLPVKINRDSKS